ncbi:polyribonucleotide nucleotidyltransferase [Tanacetum coccineum]|uniref:Polyribonucleotide nucleotidyltransferase n=1 Tax=Tanacetum coccineum TaxID=301880 RepID=A0ABQ5HX86_9ASTR
MAKMAPIDIWNVKGATFEAEEAELGLCLHLREHDEFENDDFIPDDLHDNEEDGPHIDDGKQKKRSKNRSTKNVVLDDDDCELIEESNLAFRRPTSESCKRLKKVRLDVGARPLVETEKSQVMLGIRYANRQLSAAVYEYQYGNIAFCSSTKNTGVSKKKGKGCVANYTSHSVVEVEK